MREFIFRQLARVLKAGAVIYAAELILAHPISKDANPSETDWLSCMAGAKEEEAFLDEFRAAGFQQVSAIRILRNARSKNPGVLAAEVRASRPCKSGVHSWR